VVFFAMMGMSFAQEYILFYGNGCNRSNEVLNYIKDNDVVKILDLDKKEVYYNKKNLNLLNDYLEKHDLTYDNVTVPFLIVSSGNDCNYVHGPETIIKYLGDVMEYLSGGACADTALT
jgi:hypothetical protein